MGEASGPVDPADNGQDNENDPINNEHKTLDWQQFATFKDKMRDNADT